MIKADAVDHDETVREQPGPILLSGLKAGLRTINRSPFLRHNERLGVLAVPVGTEIDADGGSASGFDAEAFRQLLRLLEEPAC